MQPTASDPPVRKTCVCGASQVCSVLQVDDAMKLVVNECRAKRACSQMRSSGRAGLAIRGGVEERGTSSRQIVEVTGKTRQGAEKGNPSFARLENTSSHARMSSPGDRPRIGSVLPATAATSLHRNSTESAPVARPTLDAKTLLPGGAFNESWSLRDLIPFHPLPPIIVTASKQELGLCCSCHRR